MFQSRTGRSRHSDEAICSAREFIFRVSVPNGKVSSFRRYIVIAMAGQTLRFQSRTGRSRHSDAELEVVISNLSSRFSPEREGLVIPTRDAFDQVFEAYGSFSPEREGLVIPTRSKTQALEIGTPSFSPERE